MGKRERVSKFRGQIGANIQRQRQQASRYGYLNLPQDIRVYKVDVPNKVGETVKAIFDILLYTVSDPHHPDRDDKTGYAVPGGLCYRRPFKRHSNVGGNNDSVVCLGTIGKPCPICSEMMRLQKEGADKKTIDALRPKDRNLYIIVPYEDKRYKEEPHIFDISQAMFQKLLNQETEEKEWTRDFPDPSDLGLTLNVRFTAKTMGSKTPFPEATRIDFEKRDYGYDDAYMKKVPDLDKMLNIMSYKELETKFFELPEEDGVETDAVADEASPETPAEQTPPTERPSRRHPAPALEPAAEEPPAEQPSPRRGRRPEPAPAEPAEDTPPVEQPVSRRPLRRPPAEPAPEKEQTRRPEEDECVACEGTKVNSRGNKCPICNGTGKRPDHTATKASEPTTRRPAPAAKDDRCPKGHRFGIDCDQFLEDCNSCDVWNACNEERPEDK